MIDSEAAEFVRRLRQVRQEQEDLAKAICEAHDSDPRRVKGALLLEYRCRVRGCLLLHVWRSPLGILFFQPAYKLSPTVNNQTSNESGRAANTLDGDRKWRPVAGVLGSGNQLTLSCDHRRESASTDELLAQADAQTPGKPLRVVV